jgi:hypothetical protein
VSEETPTPVTSPVCKLPAGSRFTIVVDGVTVEGEVTSRWSRDIAVKLVSPIGHVGASCSVPYFAAHITNYDTITGDGTARGLLEDCYRQAVLFDRYKDELARRYRDYEERVASFKRDDADRPELLRAEKIEARRRFRAGEFDQRGYQTLLKPLRKRAGDYETRLWKMKDAFMADKPWDGPESLGGVAIFLKAVGLI